MGRSKKKEHTPGKSRRGASDKRSGAGDQPPEQGEGPRFGRFVVIKAILVFGVVMGAYYYVEQRYLLNAALQDKFLGPYLELIARGVSGILNLVGHDSAWDGRFVGSRLFKVEIVHGCDALEPTFAFIAAVLASPVGVRRKIPGLLVGVAALLIINIGRIASLFLLGAYYPNALDIMHYDVWQAAFIVLAVICWAVWVQWAAKPKKPAPVMPAGGKPPPTEDKHEAGT